MSAAVSRTAVIRATAKAGETEAAERLLAALIEDLFALKPQALTINHDQYSLNSLNGFFKTEDGAFFFKFHQEEGEEAMTGEYYRADLLSRAGLPVDQPVLISTLPGEQILIYRRRHDRRFSDVLRDLDLSDDPAARHVAVAAERDLNDRLLQVCRETLHPITAAEAAAEPIHRLFHDRLVDLPAGTFPGGRLQGFYHGQAVSLPGLTLDWSEFAARRWRINGLDYPQTIGELFAAARARLSPDRLADAGGVTAHGDAHNANVWFEPHEGGARLVFFDPAFAGSHVPSLLAEIKATFHNSLAHPLWLYDPAEAARRYRAEVVDENGVLDVRTDWALSPVRRDLLAVKADHFWRPWLALLQERGLLPADWGQVIRLGLFLCPTLVMNLRAGATSHNPTSSLIGFAMAMIVGSPPAAGADLLTDWFDRINPAR